MAELLVRGLLGFLPVVVFLAVLIWLDSYKLTPLRQVLLLIVVGGLLAGVAWAINVRLIPWSGLSIAHYSRYVAPPVEDGLKVSVLVWLFLRGRIGFLVDAAIAGFAIGTGFALVENVAYFAALSEAHVGVWIVRGFGTAMMHGGATAIFGIVARGLSDRLGTRNPLVTFLPAFALAIGVHSAFNHFFFSPVFSTMLIVLGLPPLLIVAFTRSEAGLRTWLDVGFDADTELLELLHSGELSGSPVGTYLHTLKQRFRGEIVADLLCFLRLHTELALRAKGLLMMREAGFDPPPPDEATKATFTELQYLERSIGRTGKLALKPFLHFSDRELWQLYMVQR